MKDIKEDPSLYRGKPRFSCLQLPDALCFRKEFVYERVGIPIFSPVRESGVTDLKSY